jgi:hypothetical protein
LRAQSDFLPGFDARAARRSIAVVGMDMSNALAALSPVLPAGLQWRHVERRFETFIANLAITDAQFQDGWRQQAGVRSTLNRWYYGHDDETANSLLTGSWAKELRVRPPRDIDVMFCLPWDVYFRFEERTGNRQSQLLQELRAVLLKTYSTSAMRGDGQAVVVQFARMPVEVVPAFALNSGQYLIADTKHEGSWRHSDPAAELAALNRSDAATGGATRRLTRMAKQWQRRCDVPIKSFMLERFAVAFLDGWQHAHSYFYHDWMVRDFFAFMLGYVRGTVIMPGTGHQIPLGDAWASKARTAHAKASQACEWEKSSIDLLAAWEWQALFGTLIATTE